MKKRQKRILILKRYLPESLIEYGLNNYSKRLIFYLKKNIILSKILKKKYFWKNIFFTNKSTLDPRSDTEILIEIFLEYYKNNFSFEKKYKILDIGTGTGVINLSLMKELKNLRGYFLDISSKALSVCKKNIRFHKLWHCSKIILGDMKNTFVFHDFLVSNPPYLLKEEIENNSILKFDPFISLYGGEDGLYFYRILANYINLYTKYFAVIEIDHYRSNLILEIFNSYNFSSVTLKKDYNNLYRVILIIK